MLQPQTHARRHQRDADQFEQQVAQWYLTRCGGCVEGGEDREQTASEVRAENQTQCHVDRHHPGGGQRCGQQHDRQTGVSQHRQQRAGSDLQQQVAGQRRQQRLDRGRLREHAGRNRHQAQRQQHQAQSDQDAPDATRRGRLACNEQHHADKNEQGRQP